MTPTQLFARNSAARTRTHPIGRVPTLLACLLAALGFAFASGIDDEASGASEPTPIEFEGSESESTSGDSLEQTEATHSIRRLRPRDFEHAARSDGAPLSIALARAPRPRAAAHPMPRSFAGRDLLIRQQRFLI